MNIEMHNCWFLFPMLASVTCQVYLCFTCCPGVFCDGKVFVGFRLCPTTILQYTISVSCRKPVNCLSGSSAVISLVTFSWSRLFCFYLPITWKRASSVMDLFFSVYHSRPWWGAIVCYLNVCCECVPSSHWGSGAPPHYSCYPNMSLLLLHNSWIQSTLGVKCILWKYSNIK